MVNRFGSRAGGPRRTGWKGRTLGPVERAIVLAVLIGAMLFIFSGTLFLPASVKIHTNLKRLHYNQGGVVVDTHTRGCGNYWDTREIGHGVGATVQLAAGFCWNGKRVWWIWGLHRGDCQSLSNVFT